MGALDYILAPFFLAGVYGIFFKLRNRLYPEDKDMRKYFLWGLNVKMIGAFFTGMIYWFYYGGGDSTYYFLRAQRLRKVFFESPRVLMKLLFNDPNVWDLETFYHFNYMKATDLSQYIVVKIAFLTGFPAMGTYLLTAFIFAIACYIGVWRLFLKSTELFPDVKVKHLAYGVLFIPSVFFWGSGLFKDTVTMGCTAMFIVAFHDLFMKRRKIVRNFLIIVVSAYLIGIIKSYILLAMVPALLVWVVYAMRNTIKSASVRRMVTPIFIVVSIGLGAIILQQLGSVFTKFNVDNLEKKAEDMQRWHTARVEQKGDGSAYSLGHVEFTSSGILKKMPAAINVALFRPYLWESRNPVIVFAAIEAMIFLYLFIKLVVFRFSFAFKQIRKEAFLMFCVIFTIIFAFSVGFTSYNFGALVRYKIPCLPTFGIFLAVLYSRNQHKRELKEALKVEEQLPPVEIGE